MPETASPSLLPAPPAIPKLVLALIGLGSVVLLITLFYPLGFDQWLFTVGGDMVLRNGAVPYRDFIDTKPPIIFYIYGLALGIFGHHAWSIRVFDVLFQTGSLYYFYRILRRSGFEVQLAALTAFLTLFQYARGAFETTQAEGFALLPALAMIDFVLRFAKQKLADRDVLLYGALSGVMVTMLFLLKFTILPSGIGAALFVALLPQDGAEGRSWKEKSRFLAGMAGGFAISLALYFLQLTIAGGWDRFGESLSWLQAYSNHYPLISRETLVDRYFGEFPRWFLFTFTLTLFAALFGGIVKAFPSRDRASLPLSEKGGLSQPLRLFFMVGFFALLSVIYERKMNEYHYIRAFWAFTPFIAIGLFAAWEIMLREWNRLDAPMITRPLVVLFATLALFFSPLTQIIDHAIEWVPVGIEGPEKNAAIQGGYGRLKMVDAQRAADVLLPQMRPNDQVFFLGDNLELYFMLDRVPTTIGLTRKIRTAYTPQSWKQTMLDQLKAAPPRFAIIETGDRADWETDNTDDSFSALIHNPELRDYFESHYRHTGTSGPFEMFVRNGQ